MARIKQWRAGMAAAALSAAACSIAAAHCGATVDDDTLVVSAAVLHVGDGRVVSNAMIVVSGGRIVAVGAGVAGPEGATTIKVPRAHVTPGLIDANALLEPVDRVTMERAWRGVENGEAIQRMLSGKPHGPSCTCSGLASCALTDSHSDLRPEQVCPCCGFPNPIGVGPVAVGVLPNAFRVESTSEVVPETFVIDSVNLRSPDFERLLRGGVTTVYASPDSSAVIGPRGAVIRTAGPLRERVLDSAAAVHATVSGDAFRTGLTNSPPYGGYVSVRTRRPTTRMGLAWVMRKALYSTQQADRGEDYNGADSPSAAAIGVLRGVLAGDIPLRIHARAQVDIETAYRLADEFGLKFTLLEATDAYKSLGEIASHGTPVVFGPIYLDATGARARTNEVRDNKLGTLRALADAGVETAISAQDLREEDGLVRQAMYATRLGLGAEEAIKAITLTPAKLIGLGDELGSVEAGKRADLVVWSGDPLDAASRAVVVIIDGRVVLDQRKKK